MFENCHSGGLGCKAGQVPGNEGEMADYWILLECELSATHSPHFQCVPDPAFTGILTTDLCNSSFHRSGTQRGQMTSPSHTAVQWQSLCDSRAGLQHPSSQRQILRHAVPGSIPLSPPCRLWHTQSFPCRPPPPKPNLSTSPSPLCSTQHLPTKGSAREVQLSAELRSLNQPLV